MQICKWAIHFLFWSFFRFWLVMQKTAKINFSVMICILKIKLLKTGHNVFLPGTWNRQNLCPVGTEWISANYTPAEWHVKFNCVIFPAPDFFSVHIRHPTMLLSHEQTLLALTTTPQEKSCTMDIFPRLPRAMTVSLLLTWKFLKRSQVTVSSPLSYNQVFPIISLLLSINLMYKVQSRGPKNI